MYEYYFKIPKILKFRVNSEISSEALCPLGVSLAGIKIKAGTCFSFDSTWIAFVQPSAIGYLKHLESTKTYYERIYKKIKHL